MYQNEGLVLKHLNILPTWFDPENHFEEQAVFLVYLKACTPSLEQLEKYMSYERALDDIEQTDYVQKITTNPWMLSALAKSKLMSVQAYKEKVAAENKEKAIVELKIAYGYTSDDDDQETRRQKMVERYKRMSQAKAIEQMNEPDPTPIAVSKSAKETILG